MNIGADSFLVNGKNKAKYFFIHKMKVLWKMSKSLCIFAVSNRKTNV